MKGLQIKVGAYKEFLYAGKSISSFPSSVFMSSCLSVCLCVCHSFSSLHVSCCRFILLVCVDQFLPFSLFFSPSLSLSIHPSPPVYHLLLSSHPVNISPSPVAPRPRSSPSFQSLSDWQEEFINPPLPPYDLLLMTILFLLPLYVGKWIGQINCQTPLCGALVYVAIQVSFTEFVCISIFSATTQMQWRWMQFSLVWFYLVWC